MCLIRCHVRINETPSGSGVHRGPRDHLGASRPTKGCRRILRTEGCIWTNKGGVHEGGTVLSANPGSTDGVRAPTTNHWSATADHRPTGEAISAPAMQPYRVRTTDLDSDGQEGQSQTETHSTRNGREASTRTSGYDPGLTAIWRGRPQFDDAVSKLHDVSSQSGSGCGPCSRESRQEISRLPGLFRVRSNSVGRLHCSTPDGYTTQTLQLSRQAVEDAVCIQPPQGNSLEPDLATRPGGQNDWAGRPTSIDTSPGSSFWGPRPSSYRQTKNAGD